MWKQKDAEFEEGVREINEKTLVVVKSILMKGIKDGNAKLIILIFNFMRKDRVELFDSWLRLLLRVLWRINILSHSGGFLYSCLSCTHSSFFVL